MSALLCTSALPAFRWVRPRLNDGLDYFDTVDATTTSPPDEAPRTASPPQPLCHLGCKTGAALPGCDAAADLGQCDSWELTPDEWSDDDDEQTNGTIVREFGNKVDP